MPVLDIQMSLSNNNKIVYEFFEKPCANKFTITKASAHNNRMKMSVLVEEGVRRMRNCSRNLEPEVVNGVMGKWAEKLRRSGYPQTTRHQVIKTAVQKFENMCKVEDGGGRPVHRPRTWQRRERLLDKEMKAGGSWCKGETDQITAPLIMDPTAGKLGDSVRKACNDYEAATGIGVRLKLRAGAKMGADAKSEPLRSKECGRPNCFCCGSGNPGGCEKNGSAYKITCNGCGSNQIVAQYEGETGRNCFSRGLEHQNDLRTMKEDSPLWKHCVVEHNSNKQEFSMKALGGFSSCLNRQTNEAVRILNSKAHTVMNSKSEFHQAPIVRVTMSRGLELEQGEVQQGWSQRRGSGGRRGGRGAGGGG